MVLDLLSEAVLDDCFLQSYEQFIHTLLTFPSLHKVPDPVRGDEREFSGVMPSGYRFAFQNLKVGVRILDIFLQVPMTCFSFLTFTSRKMKQWA